MRLEEVGFMVAKAMSTRTHTTIADLDGVPEPVVAGLNLLVMSLDSFASLPLPSSGSVTIGRATGCDVHIEDPLASRQHARLHIHEAPFIEDLGSFNHTRVRDEVIATGEKIPVAPGDAIKIGSTVLVVQRGGQRGGQRGVQRRLWSHRHFEVRLATECARAYSSGGRFALVRLRLERPAPWTRVVPILAADLPAPHLFAAYGADDYEFLLVEAGADEVARVIGTLQAGLARLEVPVRVATTWYPRDGRTGDALLARANTLLRRPGQAAALEAQIPSNLSAPMQQAFSLATRAARANINVLLTGETGVGKEVMAQTIHRLSTRAGQACVALNCAGLSESLIESELFGHEKGAFTGAHQAKKGLFESAQGGTLFLDEIGEMPLSVQPRLLRAIETREVQPVGSLKRRSIDVRFIAATNRNLENELEKGTFRSDLFFRLNGITIAIPPLRERLSELPELAHTFTAHAARENSREPPQISDGAMALLLAYEWPGNIRELRNVIERAVVLCEGDCIETSHLPVDKMHAVRPAPERRRDGGAPPFYASGRPPEPEGSSERSRIVKALDAHAWNQSRTARALKISRRTLISKLDRLDIPRPQKGAARADAAEAGVEAGVEDELP